MSSGRTVATVDESGSGSTVVTLKTPAHARVDESLEELNHFFVGHFTVFVTDNITNISDGRNGSRHWGFLG
jgi:hypothetical protein